MAEGEGMEAGNQGRSWEITYWSISREIRAHGKWHKYFEISKPVPSDTSPPTRPRLPIIPKQFYQLGIKHSNIWAHRDHSHSNHDIICVSHPPVDWSHCHCHCWYHLAILTAYRRNRSGSSSKKRVRGERVWSLRVCNTEHPTHSTNDWAAHPFKPHEHTASATGYRPPPQEELSTCPFPPVKSTLKMMCSYRGDKGHQNSNFDERWAFLFCFITILTALLGQ